MLTINLSFQTKSSFSLLLTYGYDKLLLDMPRTKLSRRAKKSRVSVYEKGNKSEEEIPPPSPPVPISSSSPLAVKSTTSGTDIMCIHAHSVAKNYICCILINTDTPSTPALVSMETSSPSVHDLTVTYDYSTEDVPPGNGSHPTTERFLALFPFNVRKAQSFTPLYSPVNCHASPCAQNVQNDGTFSILNSTHKCSSFM